MIFISYSSCDRVVAEALLNYLENRGIKCWIAFRDITSGNFSGEITRALRDSDIMVVVCSKDSCRSEHVKNEVTLAFNKHKHIIPYLLEDDPFDDDLEYFLSLKQHIKTRNDQAKDFALIEKFIRDYRGEPAAPVVSAAPVAPAPVAPAPVAPAPATEKKIGPGLVIGIVAAVLLLGGGGAFFLLKKPAPQQPKESAVAVTQEQPQDQPQDATVAVTQEPSKEPAAVNQEKPKDQSQSQTQTKPQTQTSAQTSAQTKPQTQQSQQSQQQTTVARKPQQDNTPKTKPGASLDTFSGSVVNGYPDGFGTFTFKTRRLIDTHDADKRYAEAGDYITGDFKQGHLNYGNWYDASGNKKAFIQLGDHPDREADQKLGKCVKQ